MTHLIQISLGPVQSFISASRKTRDLAIGSLLLQRLSQAAAASLEGEPGATLIFPRTASAPAANILLATMDHGDPRGVCKSAKEAVFKELRTAISEAKKTARGLIDPSVDLEGQAESALEWYAVWTPIREDDYKAARNRAGELMASRKALRTFPTAPAGTDRPKSPLDPAFSGVLRLTDGWQVARTNEGGKTDTRVKPREHLDALGVVKRFWKRESFPSTRKIACRNLLAKFPEQVEEIEGLIKDSEADLDVGDVLFGDFGEKDEIGQEVKSRLKALAAEVKKGGRLRPYYAVLHGDGDGMGALLDELAKGTKEEKDGRKLHREFSGKLSEFSSAVPEHVAKLGGESVFAGGDDILALCPLDTAIELAKELNELFREKVGKWAETKAPDHVPTLTIGVGTVHVLENLQDAVGFGKGLEKQGKLREYSDGKPKNALCVGARPRSGSETMAAGHWESFPDEFQRHMALLSDAGAVGQPEGSGGRSLPRAYPYEIRGLAQEMRRLQRSDERLAPTDLADLVGREVGRILGRKQTSEGPTESDAVRPDDGAPVAPRSFGDGSTGALEDLEAYADMLLVAHFFTREGAE